MTSLNVSNNKLTQGKQIGTAYGEPVYETDMSGRWHRNPYLLLMLVVVGVIALADSVKNNGALSSVDISENAIKADGAKLPRANPEFKN